MPLKPRRKADFSARLNIAPRPKERPRYARGHTYTPKATKDYEAQIRELLREEMADRELFEGPLVVELDFYLLRPTSGKNVDSEYPIRVSLDPDGDNLAKAVLDSAHDVLYQNDVCVVELIARKLYSCTDQPSIQIAVWKL